MVVIGKTTLAAIRERCRDAKKTDLDACVDAVSTKLESEVEKLCDRTASQNNFSSQSCQETLLSFPWVTIEQLKKKAPQEINPAIEDMENLHPLGASDETWHRSLFTFMIAEAQNYEAYQILSEAQCMTLPEWKLFKRINQDRAQFKDEYMRLGEGMALPLKVDCDLVRVARAFSKDMATRHYFHHDHTDLEGKNAFQRIDAVTQRYSAKGENIAKGGGVYNLENITRAEDDFMNYPPGQMETHRANVLCPHFTNAGVSVFVGDHNEIFVTEDFGGLPK